VQIPESYLTYLYLSLPATARWSASVAGGGHTAPGPLSYSLRERIKRRWELSGCQERTCRR